VLDLSDLGQMDCQWREPCTGTISGTIPLDYRAPLSGSPVAVRTFRIEDPASYARIAFHEALARAGVVVRAPCWPRMIRAGSSPPAPGTPSRRTSRLRS